MVDSQSFYFSLPPSFLSKIDRDNLTLAPTFCISVIVLIILPPVVRVSSIATTFSPEFKLPSILLVNPCSLTDGLI